jgi:hypothetical protein
MNIKRSCVISGTVIGLTVMCHTAFAQSGCSSGMLRGSYAFSATGELIGLLDEAGLHRYATPSVLNDVAIVSFDGVNGFTRTDFGNTNGAPKTPDFNPSQTGSYTVNSNCTGTMTIKYPSNVELDLEMVIADDGSIIKAVIGTETVPSSTAADGTQCNGSCKQAVQVSFDGRRVFEPSDHRPFGWPR